MLLSSIKVGDRIEINSNSESALKRTFISQYEGSLNNKLILVQLPISYGQTVNLSMKETYNFIFFADKGMISADVKIIKYVQKDNVKYMIVEIISEPEKIQRREFFRFACLLQMKFAIVPIETEEVDLAKAINEEEILYSGIIKDIGGGGIRYVSNDDIAEHQKVKCVIFLNNEFMVALGYVLHKQHFPKSNYHFQYRVQFLGVIPSEQEKIIQFIFDEQRKLLQKNRQNGV